MSDRLPSIEDIEAELSARTAGAGYRRDPVAFVHDCVDWAPGQGLAPYQDETLAELVVRRRVSCRGPHGLGKTTTAALAVIWFGLTRDPEDWKAPTTASAWRQLSKYLWPEVHKWARRLRWDRLRRGPFDPHTELQVLSLKLRGGEAFALASNDYVLLEGAHASRMLYVFDEAKSIPAATWDAAEGAFATAGADTTDEAYALAISTPGPPSGRFYEIHARRPGYEDWWVRHVSLEEAIAAGRISREWAVARLRQWGAASPVYQNRVLGEFAAADDTSLIPLAWIEAANERWLEWEESGRPGADALTAVGVDVGGGLEGGDETVLAPRAGDVITEVLPYPTGDTMATTGRVKVVLDARGGTAVVDVIGIGAGVVGRLRELKAAVAPFHAANKTDATDRSGELRFLNLRAAAWWGLRERLDPQYGPTLALPPDDLLTGDLTAARMLPPLSDGRLGMEEKAAIKKRIGRSTDRGDAVVMACAYELLRPRVTGSPVGVGSGASVWRIR